MNRVPGRSTETMGETRVRGHSDAFLARKPTSEGVNQPSPPVSQQSLDLSARNGCGFFAREYGPDCRADRSVFLYI